MFNVGANNPNVGNDRRKGLIDQLAQQLAQRFAQQRSMDPGFSQYQGNTPLINLQKKRPHGVLAAASAPSRVAGQGRPTAGTPLIAMPLGGGHSAAARPAMVPGRLSGHMSPTPGAVAVPQAPGGPANPLAPFSPAPSAAPSASSQPPAAAPMYSPTGNGADAYPVTNPASPLAAIAAVPDSAETSPAHGWMSIGNGMFYNPMTGMVRGPSAGIGNGLIGVDGKF